MRLVGAIRAICELGRRRMRKRGGYHIWGGPKTRTKRHLRGCEENQSAASRLPWDYRVIAYARHTLVVSVVACAGLRQSRRPLLFCRMNMLRDGGRSSRGRRHARGMISKSSREP